MITLIILKILRSGKIHNKAIVPYFNFGNVPDWLKEDWANGIEGVISDGVYIGGNRVVKFEKSFGEYLGAKHVIGVGNGFDALVIALKTLEIKQGDLVAVPAHTFIATWLAVQAVGAIPYGVDSDLTGLIDLELLENTRIDFKAVIPVHMHGQAVDMVRLKTWSELTNTLIIEDCAQAHGAEINQIKVGNWSDISAFSFYPTKNLGALGDAGAIVTSSDFLAEKARNISNYGLVDKKSYYFSEIGMNSRIDPIQATILNINLNYLDTWNQKRRSIAMAYLDKIKLINNQPHLAKNESVWHHFVIQVKERDLVRSFLSKLGVETEIHYPRMASDIYSEITGKPSEFYPVAKQFTNSVLSLPLNQWLSDQEVSITIRAMNEDFVQSKLL